MKNLYISENQNLQKSSNVQNPQGFATAHAWLNLEGFCLSTPHYNNMYNSMLHVTALANI